MRFLQLSPIPFALVLATTAQPALARGHAHHAYVVHHHHHYRHSVARAGHHHRYHRYAHGYGYAARRHARPHLAFGFAGDWRQPQQEAWQASWQSNWQSAWQPAWQSSWQSWQSAPYASQRDRFARRAGYRTRERYAEGGRSSAYAGMVARYAAANGVPASLVHRVIMRESRYNPRAVSRGNYGIMQIRLGTARAMGYRGSAAGLLDPGTNMTYAVRYLAGAYRAAGGNPSRAVALYARGYGAPRASRRRYAFLSSGPYYDEAPAYRARHHRHHWRRV